MGSIYSTDLPSYLGKWEVPYTFYDAQWETRSRSSGGWNQIWAIGIHHDASTPTTSPKASCDYMWKNASDRPIGNCLLDRTGHVTLGAGGASNTQGKGGPYTVSRGIIPLDTGNTYMYSIEAANNGLGEPWPQIQQENYILLCCAIFDWCKSIGQHMDPRRDIVSHFEWAPTRKIDPAGASRWATGSNKWNMAMFRTDVADFYSVEPAPTPPDGDVDEELFKQWVSDVFNQQAFMGSDGTYKNCFDIIRNVVQQNANSLATLNKKVDELTKLVNTLQVEVQTK